mmetsp:Transcript_121236/g.343478  ORF Transcript_121236/g.343478 Transcript_121236/m.343478 type:complete len:216 (+) Transcript_121236:377-1024(+)
MHAQQWPRSCSVGAARGWPPGPVGGRAAGSVPPGAAPPADPLIPQICQGWAGASAIVSPGCVWPTPDSKFSRSILGFCSRLLPKPSRPRPARPPRPGAGAPPPAAPAPPTPRRPARLWMLWSAWRVASCGAGAGGGCSGCGGSSPGLSCANRLLSGSVACACACACAPANCARAPASGLAVPSAMRPGDVWPSCDSAVARAALLSDDASDAAAPP